MKKNELIMTKLARFVCKYYRLILIVFVLILIGSLISMQNIQTVVDVNSLLPKGNLKVKSFDRINDIFDGGNSIIIAVEGNDKETMKQVAETVKFQILANEKVNVYVKSVTTKIDRDFLLQWAMMLQKSDDIQDTADSLSKYNILPLIRSINKSMNDIYTGDDAKEDITDSRQENDAVALLSRIESFMMHLTDTLQDNAQSDKDKAVKLADTFIFGDQYTFSYDNSMILFAVNTNISLENFDAIDTIMYEVNKIFGEIENSCKGISLSCTGEIASQADENKAMNMDMVIPSIIAFCIILVLFYFSFNKFRVVLFTMGTLAASIFVNYGIIGITIKEISLLTSVLSALLVGMGIDYGVQVASNFIAFQEQGHTPEEIVRLTFVRSGIGSLMAAITTSVSFYVISFTKSKALQHFGVIAGNGILVCFTMMIFIVPSLFLLLSKSKANEVRKCRIPFDKMAQFSFGASKLPKIWIFIILAVTAGMLIASFSLNFEYDLMKLGPQKMESLATQELIKDKFSTNVFYSMLLADSIGEARKYTEKLEKVSMISEIKSIASFLLSDEEQKNSLATIQQLKAKLPQRKPYKYTSKDVLFLADQLQELEWNIIELGDLSVAGLGDNNKIIKKRNSMIREIFGAEEGKEGNEVFKTCIDLLKSDPKLYAARLNSIEQYFSRQFESNVRQLYSANRLMTVNDIPEDYRLNLYDEETGKCLIQILPKNYVNDSTETLIHYNKTLDAVHQEITGAPQLAFSWFSELIRESKKSALYILFIVLLFMYINFKSIKYTLTALIPLVISLIWTGGILYLLKVKLSGVTVAMFPLIIGIGISYGTYTTHRFIVEGKNFLETLKYTTKPVFLSAITTIIGFGTLAFFASYYAIAQIGLLLFTGITCSYFATIIVLPLFLGFSGKTEKAKCVSETDDKGSVSEFIK